MATKNPPVARRAGPEAGTRGAHTIPPGPDPRNPIAIARRHLVHAFVALMAARDAASDEHVRAGLASALADVQSAGRRLDALRAWWAREAA